MGLSLFSDPVSILAAHEPDAPLNVADRPEITTAYQIGLIWTEGAYNGGTHVIDFKIRYKMTGGSDAAYVTFADNHAPTTITVTGLTPGTIYDFVILARNVINYSAYSEYISILAA